MFSTKRKSLKDIILENSYEVFQMYFPFEENKMYLSPLREDRLPSFHILYNNVSGQYYFHDFGYRGGSCISFVMLMFNLDFTQACNKIKNDLQLGDVYTIPKKSIISHSKQEKKEYNIQFIPRAFNVLELAYWAQYGITEEECKENEIFVASKLFINDKLMYIPKNNLQFIYRFTKDGEPNKKKIYKPFSKDFKWSGNISIHHLEGIKTLPKISNIVIGTKSRKDRIILQKIWSEVFNMQNEHPKSISHETDIYLDNNYDAKFLWLDVDDVGKNTNIQLNKRGYLWINNPNELYVKYNLKDPADIIKHFGTEEGYKILKKELKKKNII